MFHKYTPLLKFSTQSKQGRLSPLNSPVSSPHSGLVPTLVSILPFLHYDSRDAETEFFSASQISGIISDVKNLRYDKIAFKAFHSMLCFVENLLLTLLDEDDLQFEEHSVYRSWKMSIEL